MSNASSLRLVRDLLARRATGGLTSEETATLTRCARILQRRRDRLLALDPGLAGCVELSPEIEELAQPPALSASN